MSGFFEVVMNPSFSEEILTVLYVLFRARTALKSEHIVDCLEDTTIDYFTAHQILEQLLDNKTVIKHNKNGYDLYMLSPIGKDSIEQFYPMIRASTRKCIDNYLALNIVDMSDSIDIDTSYCYSYDDKYIVTLKSYDDNICVMDISMTVDSREIADLLINGWKNKSADIYSYILQELVK